jgi:hypothetical protein
MKVKVKDNAAAIYCAAFKDQAIPYKEYADILRKVQGTVLDVDTKYLFLQSVNAIYNEIENKIMDLNHRFIDWIEDDERIGTYKCGWCGGHQKGNTEPCQCGQEGYLDPIWRDCLVELLTRKDDK